MKNKLFPIVGIGTSAGGLEALESFFRAMPRHPGIAFVVISHLEPSHKSLLAELLGRVTGMSVIEAAEGMRLRPDRVYIIPPNKKMALRHGALRLFPLDEPRSIRLPVDFFFASLAEECGAKAVSIILSGAGSDGLLGAKKIHEAGGVTFVQDPKTAAYESMPRSIIGAGLADFILPPAEIPKKLLWYGRRIYPRRARAEAAATRVIVSGLEKIFALLHRETGHDFSRYKKSTIYRRIERRMALLDIGTINAYAEHLSDHPHEVKTLFRDCLIVVTSFFRDPDSFKALKEKSLPAIFGKKGVKHTVRVWVPGCATGEEVYSLAMLMQEYLDEHALDCRFQIFGTDIDEDAISAARAGLYPPSIVADVSAERLRRFFIKEENGYRIKRDLREKAVFAIHNLATDIPFTKLDLVSCRNLLIYFESELQERVIPFFHYSLKPEGFLLLGPSESIGRYTDLFGVLDKKWRLYTRRMTSAARAAIFDRSLAFTLGAREESHRALPAAAESVESIAQKMLLDSYVPPAVLINAKGDILYFHGKTGLFLEPPSGEANLNVLSMAKDALKLELRGLVRDAASRKKTAYGAVTVRTSAGRRLVNVSVDPVTGQAAGAGLALVVFDDIGPAKQAAVKRGVLTAAISRDKQIRALERDLVAARRDLQATIERHQALNEELKSMNEELQSTNEELQSANEELETSREEAQSVNEELVSVNNELQSKVDIHMQTENDMKNMLESTHIGVIFLDNDLAVKRFTPQVTKIVNLIQTDIGRPLSDISPNIDYKDLVSDARHVLKTLVYKEFETETRDGEWYLVRIMPYRTLENVIDGVVITFTAIGRVRAAAERIRALAVRQAEGRRKRADDAACRERGKRAKGRRAK